ncbi:MAG: hypothetical protein A2X94_06390 [Bdellovibrionales bacterium GWB1_55_8]|nr:MAG: hypothetical protein A2X94_06390 [Bdellovibrionales bacterium GWB1_55_8]
MIAFASRLLFLAAFFQLFDGVQITGSGVLRGFGNTRASMFANLVGHWGLGIPIGAALAFGAGWGVFGLWVGLSIGLIFVATTLTLLWRSLVK